MMEMRQEYSQNHADASAEIQELNHRQVNVEIAYKNYKNVEIDFKEQQKNLKEHLEKLQEDNNVKKEELMKDFQAQFYTQENKLRGMKNDIHQMINRTQGYLDFQEDVKNKLKFAMQEVKQVEQKISGEDPDWLIAKVNNLRKDYEREMNMLKNDYEHTRIEVMQTDNYLAQYLPYETAIQIHEFLTQVFKPDDCL